MKEDASKNVPEFAVGSFRLPHLPELGDAVIAAKAVLHGRIQDAKDVRRVVTIHRSKQIFTKLQKRRVQRCLVNRIESAPLRNRQIRRFRRWWFSGRLTRFK